MELTTILWKQIEQSYTYQEFFNKVETEVIQWLPNEMITEDKKFLQYKKLNLQRMKRIEKTFEVSKELEQLLLSMNASQHWVVLTEGWCGDSAQNLPAIAKIAEVNPLVELKIIERDQNLEIMDMYLTNGTRSIPILTSLDDEGNELFRWGPRPKEAQELVTRLKNEGMEHDAFVEQLHLWYAKNKGITLEMEFMKLLSPAIIN